MKNKPLPFLSSSVVISFSCVIISGISSSIVVATVFAIALLLIPFVVSYGFVGVVSLSVLVIGLFVSISCVVTFGMFCAIVIKSITFLGASVVFFFVNNGW